MPLLGLNLSLLDFVALLNLPMNLVTTAKTAEFLQFQPLGLGLLVLGRTVVLVFALGALQRNDFAHVVFPIPKFP
jgi:hypothetical protein